MKVKINFEEWLENQVENWETAFYNGGWIKHITAVDTEISTGYCYEGDLVNKDQLIETETDIYVICTIQGSRKRPEKQYFFVRLKPNGEIEKVIEDKIMGYDWALQTRDLIANLPEFKEQNTFNPELYFNSLDLNDNDRKVLIGYIKTL